MVRGEAGSLDKGGFMPERGELGAGSDDGSCRKYQLECYIEGRMLRETYMFSGGWVWQIRHTCLAQFGIRLGGARRSRSGN